MTNPIALSVGIIAATVIIGTAIVVAENPEVIAHVNNFRRRFARGFARRYNGRGFTEDDYEEFDDPVFNRPEDAEGFRMSENLRKRNDSDDEADLNDDDVTEETRIRQREELNYWKAMHESKEMDEARKVAEKADEDERKNAENNRNTDLLNAETNATSVYHSGSDLRTAGNSMLRRRGEAQPNPATDSAVDSAVNCDSPSFRVVENIYDASPRLPNASIASPFSAPVSAPVVEEPSSTTLFDANDNSSDRSSVTAAGLYTPTSERSNPFSDEHANENQPVENHNYSSVHAWVANGESFYSAVPSQVEPSAATPLVAGSNSSGSDSGRNIATPADSMSQTGSAVVIGHAADVMSNPDSRFDVLSQTDGMHTPASWSDVGSVISENGSH